MSENNTLFYNFTKELKGNIIGFGFISAIYLMFVTIFYFIIKISRYIFR